MYGLTKILISRNRIRLKLPSDPLPPLLNLPPSPCFSCTPVAQSHVAHSRRRGPAVNYMSQAPGSDRPRATLIRHCLKGHFTVKKTSHVLSNQAIDQPYDRHKAVVKDGDGAVGLTECPAALQRWMFSGIEMTCVIIDFEI